jgi:hypothetical protein
MNSLARCLIVLVVGCSCAALPRMAECQTKSPTKVVNGSVSGRVTIHGKGAPGIAVTARSQATSEMPVSASQPMKAITDADGNYRLTAIPPGNYQIFPIAPAYVPTDLMNSGGRKVLLLGENEDVQGIDFSLQPGGVITGRVTDAEGRPMIEERVTLTTEGDPNTRGRMTVWGSERGLTDDRGIYRLYGIPAGRYKISAGISEEDPYFEPRAGRVNYKRTYYADTTEFDNAKVIEVVEGGELKNIDIALGRSVPTFSASGRAVDSESGKPVMGLRFMLQRTVEKGTGAPMVPSFSTSNSLGEFRIENIPPGKYMVIVSPDRDSELRTDAVPFEIVDQDVSGLLVKTFKGLSVTGNIVVEGTADKTILSKISQMRLHVYSRDEATRTGGGREAVVSPDGTFRVTGLPPGILNFYLGQGFGEVQSFFIIRIERDGVVQPRGLQLKTGDNLFGVTLVLAYGTASIRGEVKLENGSLPPDGRVTVWTTKANQTSEPGFNSRPQTVDVRNHFLIESLAAGTYDLYVSVYVPGRPLAQVKQLVTVTEGGTTDVEVTVDLKANPEQPPQP